MLHIQTQKIDLVDKLFHLGLSISYDHVLHLSAEMGNSVCQHFHMDHVVCPSLVKNNVFTTAVIDNIDHNPSATTAKDSFQGTRISLIQHPTSAEESVVHSVTVITGSNAGSKTVGHLPHFYAGVPPVTASVKNSAVPSTNFTSLKWDNYKKQAEGEHEWLKNTRHVLKQNAEFRSNENIYCLLYTSDAADEEDSVDLGGRRIIKKKKQS